MRYRYFLRDGKLVNAEVIKIRAPLVMPDIPAYISPIDGRVISGRRARRYDLARSGSRPYEGREQELKEAARQAEYERVKQDKFLDETVRRAYAQIHPDVRRKFEGD